LSFFRTVCYALFFCVILFFFAVYPLGCVLPFPSLEGMFFVFFFCVVLLFFSFTGRVPILPFAIPGLVGLSRSSNPPFVPWPILPAFLERAFGGFGDVPLFVEHIRFAFIVFPKSPLLAIFSSIAGVSIYFKGLGMVCCVIQSPTPFFPVLPLC